MGLIPYTEEELKRQERYQQIMNHPIMKMFENQCEHCDDDCYYCHVKLLEQEVYEYLWEELFGEK